MASLVLPQTVFLDTNHISKLRDVARGRPAAAVGPVGRVEAYRAILSALRRGALIPMVCMDQVFEWCHNRSLEDATSTAAVLDTAPVVRVIGERIFVLVQELVEAARRVDQGMQFDGAAMSWLVSEPDWSLRTFARHFPGAGAWYESLGGDGRCRRFESVAQMTDTAHRILGLESAPGQYLDANFESDFKAMKAQRPGIKGFSRASRLDYACRNLRLHEVIQSCNPSMDIAPIIAGIDLCSCPGFDLWNRVHWEYFRATAQPRRTDLGDLAYVHVLPYVQWALVERRLCGLVRSADAKIGSHVLSEPNELLRAAGCG